MNCCDGKCEQGRDCPVRQQRIKEVNDAYINRKPDPDPYRETLKLWERPNLANDNRADLFISIHCNANNNRAAAGSETYLWGYTNRKGIWMLQSVRMRR